jgi:DNA-binding NtrC family response regulator
MQVALRAAREAVSAPGGVLIFGEVGSGRETLARAIHAAATSPGGRSLDQWLQQRPSTVGSLMPFVTVECATTPNLEQRLFGRTSTAGRDGLESTSRSGLLLKASDGMLFLRSLQEMPRRVQSRLARVLRDGEVWLEAGDASRVVAVTSRVAASMDATTAADGETLVPELRQRLTVHQMDVPPLRQRRDDLPALVRLMLVDVCCSRHLPLRSASLQATSLLSALPWRGNLNELRALLEALVGRVAGRRIRLADVLANVRLDGADVTFSSGGTLREARARFEREYVSAVLEQHQGRMADAAKALGVQRANLYRKVRQLAVRRTVPVPSTTALLHSSDVPEAPRVRQSGPRPNDKDSMEVL